MPSLEEARQNESEEEAKKRDIRNQRRKVDWENECKAIEFRGPFVDRYPWVGADTKIKSLLYLSIGTKGTQVYHQNNPHTKSTHAPPTNLHMNYHFLSPKHGIQPTIDSKFSTHVMNHTNHSKHSIVD